jgi:hypothetical protein
MAFSDEQGVLKDQRRFFSVDYIDEDGDQCIKHVLATPEEIQNLMSEFAKRRTTAVIYEISSDVVSSEHVQLKQLG